MGNVPRRRSLDTMAARIAAAGARAWTGFWFAPSSPESLGVARAVFFGALFLLYLPEDFSAWGRVDRVFWAPIWLFRALHLEAGSPALLSILQVIFKLSLLLGAIGLWTRAA